MYKQSSEPKYSWKSLVVPPPPPPHPTQVVAILFVCWLCLTCQKMKLRPSSFYSLLYLLERRFVLCECQWHYFNLKGIILEIYIKSIYCHYGFFCSRIWRSLLLCFISFQLFMNSLVKHTNTWAKLQITTG